METSRKKRVVLVSARSSSTFGRSNWATIAILHLLIVVAALMIGFPFYYMISTSLKTLPEVYAVPMVWFPKRLQ